jgi:oligopeptide/dipeptide ABC transporter ATP-binding protein
VVIAIALACGPDLLIADEPTTALDVTIQREVLDLIRELVREDGMGLVLISHDLGVMADSVQDLLVMYAGTVVEAGPTAAVFERLAHPYTRGLFAARPRLGLARGTRLATIPGRVPELADMPAGCPFADRCERVHRRLPCRRHRRARWAEHWATWRALPAGDEPMHAPQPLLEALAAGHLAKRYRLPRESLLAPHPKCRRWTA